MIKVENVSVMNFKNAIRGMRNAHASWDKSDSDWCWNTGFTCDNCPWGHACTYNYAEHDGGYILGPNDLDLATRLVKAGSDERKFLRQIFVSVDITAPMYFLKEFDTYKIGTVSNSTSVMHSITNKEFTLDDFSHEHLYTDEDNEESTRFLEHLISGLNFYRRRYNGTHNKKDWWQIIQLLPSSYNQMRTWTANYEVLRNIYHARKNHKLDCWKEFCEWIETLPYASELICN